jgi:hypothetical protein
MDRVKIASIIFVFLGVAGCSQSYVALIKAYEKLHNSHDIEGTMLLYHERIEFELAGVWLKSGKEDIRELAEWDAALNSSLRFEAIEVKGDSVFCKVIEENDWFKGVGIDQIIHDPTIFIVADGQIRKIIARPSEGVGAEIGIKLGSIYSWSKQTGDTAINELIIDGEFIYSGEAAKKWLVLLSNWKE